MLAIRMQRTGRKGYATFRIIVQDSRFSPSSGRVVARVGNYNPHTKEKNIDIEKIEQFLNNGAQPTPRVVRLLKEEKVKLPSWVAELDNSKKKSIKNPEKLRKNQPGEPVEEAPAEAPEVEATPEAEAPAENTEATENTESAAESSDSEAEQPGADEKPAEEAKSEQKAEEKPAEEEKPEEKPEATEETETTEPEAKEEA